MARPPGSHDAIADSGEGGELRDEHRRPEEKGDGAGGMSVSHFFSIKIFSIKFLSGQKVIHPFLDINFLQWFINILLKQLDKIFKNMFIKT